MPLTPYPQADASGRILYSFSTWVTKESSHEMPRGDPRLNALGGVSLRGDTGTGSGLGCTSSTPALSSEFEIVACVRRTSSDATMRHLACIQTSGGNYNVVFGAATSGGIPMLGWGGNYEVDVPNPTDWHWASFGHDSLGWFFTLDGVLTRSASLPGQTPVAINRVFAGDSGVGQFGGDVARCWRFNFVLSAAQRSALILNDPAGDLVSTGAVRLSSSVGSVTNGTYASPFSGFSYAGGVLAYSCTGVSHGADLVTGPTKKGTRWRISGTVTANTLNTYSVFVGSTAFDGSEVGSIAPGFVGAFSVSGVQNVDGPLRLICIGATGSVSISGMTVEQLGAVGRWEPLNVTLLPRWLDSSGNGNDLIPATTNSGLTPLNPQPSTVRVQGFSVNTASTVDTNAAGPLYTVTKSGTGTVVFTPKPILGSRPNWVASNAATGQDTVTSSIQTNGVNTVQAHRSNTVVDDTIEGVIAHLE